MAVLPMPIVRLPMPWPQVPMDAIRHFVGTGVVSKDNDDMLMDTLNGSIVGLCIGDNRTCPTINRDCVGLGIVRSVDKAKRLLYILTPVDASKDILPTVTALVKGSLELPTVCIYRGFDSEAFPYLACKQNTAGSIGGDIMKSRNNIGRKK